MYLLFVMFNVTNIHGEFNDHSVAEAACFHPQLVNHQSSATNLPKYNRHFINQMQGTTTKYSRTSIYRFSRGWRKQTMNVGKRLIRETTFFLTKKVVHCLLLLGRILPQLKI